MVEHIPVFLTSDNAYAPFVAVTIVSVMENTKSFVDFYVLDSGVSEESKRKIRCSIKKYPNCYVEFIGMDDASFDHLPEAEVVHITKATYNRLLIPVLKPDLKKVIYSDVDVVFLGDIKELYDESLDGETIGVVHDAGFLIYDNLFNYRGRLDLPPGHQFFYAGLLLIDVEKWNNDNITKKLMQISYDCCDKLFLGDQDILNIYFGSKYKLLSAKYEATNTYVLNSDKFDEIIKKDLEKIVIRHFEGPEKPWCSHLINGIIMPHENDFWRYAGKTKFYSMTQLALVSFQRRLTFFLELFYCPLV